MSALPEYITAMHTETYDTSYLVEILEKRGITEYEIDDLIEVIQENHKYDFPEVSMKRIIYITSDGDNWDDCHL
jgi:hypothetical protein